MTKLQSRSFSPDDSEPVPFDIEVSYRPKGCVTYSGDTKYDGWTAMMLDRMKDGTLLDGAGKPLPEGQPPVYRPVEVYKDAEFGELDFGEFIEEVEQPGVKHVAHDEVLEGMKNSGKVSASVHASFMAPRRSRPEVKIILSNAPSGKRGAGLGRGSST